MLLVFIFTFLMFIVTAKIKVTIVIANDKMNILLSIFVLGKICIYKSRINYLKKSKKSSDSKGFRNNNLLIAKIIKSSKLNIEQLNLGISICTTDAVATSYLVAIVSTFISCFIKISNVQINNKKCHYEIKPVYSNQKVLDIKLKCIITKNLVYIMFIIYRNIKDWRREKYGGKSSNRGAYGNCNG